MSMINTIVVAGGTHGNERTGVSLVQKWMANPECYATLCKSAKVDLVLSNPEAMRLNRRYRDHDLNRAFSQTCLDVKAVPQQYEFRRAKELNEIYGPKGPNTKTDLLLDVHNTGSNMGYCLILSARDPFCMRASAVLTQEFKNAWIYYQPEERSASPYFGTVAKADICIEIGPQHHGTLNAAIFEESERLVKRYLELAEEWNRGELQKRAPITVDVYTQWRDLGYPKPQGGGPIQAMIHPEVLGFDYRELREGDNLFRTFDGKDIPFKRESSDPEVLYPIFINEPAYYEKDIAMSLTVKTVEEW
ncbi:MULTISPECIES: aspartoacylase [unclassified Fibrobacter]|uniref:aspartoacylase n=1 Tax=unclassified Fibrobacter TaxID=2634177 RepID=UPI000D796890|nr:MULTISPECIES: aspartoacylase [unclassified Fibrobacter]PWJ65595.1 aspartoacylase [Fibrobacter sp. UWR4]PZW72360.1 aspartoacylase [Fibrobacter sp. UWR1]